MNAARLTSRWKFFNYFWPAVVIGALLLNVLWPPYAGYSIWALSLVAYPIAAALILTNRPGNPIGRVLAVVSVAAGVIFVGGWVVQTWRYQEWSAYVEALISAAVPVLFWGALSLLYLFPTGEVPRSSFRFVFRLFTIWIGVMALLAPFDPGATVLTARTNPIAGPPWIGTLYDLGVFILMPGLIGGVWAAIARYRSAGVEIRAQLKWFMAGIVAVVGLVAVITFIPEELPPPYEQLANVVVVVGFWALPGAIVVAMTRYHLYEIDRLVSRSISYTLVVGALAGTFFGLTTAISILIPSQSSLAVAASTLVVAALFNPLRKRAQTAVDKRFNRSAFEAELVVEQFAESLRGPLAVEQVGEIWSRAVAELFQPEATTLWLAKSSALRSGPER